MHTYYADCYETKNIWVAALLDARGVPFLRCVPLDGRRSLFLFANDQNRAYDLAHRYYERPDEATASVPALAESYRKMAGASHAARQQAAGQVVA